MFHFLEKGNDGLFASIPNAILTMEGRGSFIRKTLKRE